MVFVSLIPLDAFTGDSRRACDNIVRKGFLFEL